MKRDEQQRLNPQNNALLGSRLKKYSHIVSNILKKTNITDWRQRNIQFLLKQYIQNLKGPSDQYSKATMNLYLDCQVQKHRFQEDRFDYDVKTKLWNSCEKVQNGEDQQYKVNLYDYVKNITDIVFWKSVPVCFLPLNLIKCQRKYKKFSDEEINYIISTFNMVKPVWMDYLTFKVIFSFLVLLTIGSVCFLVTETGKKCFQKAFNYIFSWIPFKK